MLLKRVQCPKCAESGADTRGDNLAIYPDGHKYCYGCGYHEPAPLTAKLLTAPKPEPTAGVFLPDDYSRTIPYYAVSWLAKYGLTHAEILRNEIGWSAKRDLLIFPVLDGDRNLLMWQGRSFKVKVKLVPVTGTIDGAEINYGNREVTVPDGPKYITKGNPSEIIHLITPDGALHDLADHVIITEGVVDAIKVGRVFNAMPCWGSNLSLEHVRRLSRRFGSMGIWWDSDKRVEAVKMALWASQYMPTYVVLSTKDPKEYQDEHLLTFVKAATRHQLHKGTGT